MESLVRRARAVSAGPGVPPKGAAHHPAAAHGGYGSLCFGAVSPRAGSLPPYDLGIKSKVRVNRAHEPANPFYEYTEIRDISGLPGVFGL